MEKNELKHLTKETLYGLLNTAKANLENCSQKFRSFWRAEAKNIGEVLHQKENGR